MKLNVSDNSLALNLDNHLYIGREERQTSVGGGLLYPGAARLLSPVLLLLPPLPAQSQCVQLRVGRLLAAPSLDLGLDQRVHHGHVDVQVVGLLEALPAHQARKVQVRLRLVFGHVVFKRCSLATLETAHLTSDGKTCKP